MPTINDYHIAVIKAHAVHPEWRHGQAAFNVLDDMRPDLSEQIRGNSDLDPFYADHKKAPTVVFNAFYTWVTEHWDDPIPSN